MRSFAFVAAALAATAAATPMKRDEVIVTDTAVEMDYVTDIITVTAGQESAATTTVAAAAETTTTAAAVTFAHYGHHRSWHKSSAAASSAAASSEAPAAPSSTSEAAATSSVVVYSTSEAAPSSSAVAETSSVQAYSSSVATSASSAAGALATTYQQAVLVHHNYHRSNHSAANIQWDASLASTALSIAQTCNYAHNMTANGGGYGQNIAAGVEAFNVSAVITDLFYNGEVNAFNGLYGQANPDMSNFENWGHFSQIVWKDTTHVGCATYDCSNAPSKLKNTGAYVRPFFTVCNYSPPGNYGGEYGTNIGNSLGHATKEWHDGVAANEESISGSY